MIGANVLVGISDDMNLKQLYPQSYPVEINRNNSV